MGWSGLLPAISNVSLTGTMRTGMCTYWGIGTVRAPWQGGHAGGRRGTDPDVGLTCGVGRQVVSVGLGAGGGQGTGSVEGLHEGLGGCKRGRLELYPSGEFPLFLPFHPLPVPELQLEIDKNSVGF